MKKMIIISLFATLLLAQNPRVYSSLGDGIYENAPSIEKLKEIKEFSEFEDKIATHIKEVEKTKKDGFAIESGDSGVDKREYLRKLRELSKQDSYFARISQKKFKESMKQNNHELFTELVNSGMIDTKKYKKKILDYYDLNKDEIVLSGELKMLVESDRSKQKSKADLKKSVKKQDKASQRIEHIKKRDKEKEQEREEMLEEELLQKKREIREYQKKELINH